MAPLTASKSQPLAAPAPTSTDPFCRFRLLEPIGVGGDGASYRGLDLETGREVFIGLADANLASERKLEIRRRIQLVELLKHRNKAPLVAFDLNGPRPFWATDSLDLAPLDRVAERQPQVGASEWLQTALQIAELIGSAHCLGLLHGNLTTTAVGLDRDGAVAVDFLRLQTGSVAAADDSGAEQPKEDSQEREIAQLGRLVHWIIDGGLCPAALRGHFSGRRMAALRQTLQMAYEGDLELRCGVDEMIAALRDAASELALAKSPAPQPAAPNTDTTNILVTVPHANNSDAAGTNELLIDAEAALARQTTEREPVVGDMLGRFELIKLLGQGGMGKVFKARDIASGAFVAVKTISIAGLSRKNGLQRFHKEARLLAALKSPYVANLIEVNRDGETHYLVLELVEGVTLKDWLRLREKFEEREALSIVGDLARALVNAHQKEIVHRDIKPENVLVQRTLDQLGDDAVGDRQAAFAGVIRLTDFGIAREIVQSESLAVTQAGAMIGTPLYMSPEQCRAGEVVSPKSDVYSLGITLYEMLVGKPPFQSNDAMKLAAMHCFDPPPSVAARNPDVSERTIALLEKALAKEPESRFADAGHFLHEIECILRGEVAGIESRPRTPAHSENDVVRREYEWTLDAAPEQLWPLVADTDRLNQAMGLPAPQFVSELHPTEGVQTYAKVAIGPFTMQWREHAFEWVEGRRYGVLREFQSGPFVWFTSTVDLLPTGAGKTRLKHTVEFAPRNWLGSVFAHVETRWKTAAALDRIYRRMEKSICAQRNGSPTIDPFADTPPLPQRRKKRLQSRLEELITAGAPLESASRLGAWLESTSPQDLARIRPLRLADMLCVDENEALELCLRAAKVGLLQLQWDILCPTCRLPAGGQQTLRELEKHVHCEACQLDFDLDFAQSVELVFGVHPEIRVADTQTYCIGGPAKKPHIVAQLRLEPGERLELELALEPGEFAVKSRQLPRTQPIRIAGGNSPSRAELSFGGKEPSFDPVLRPGKQLLALTSEIDQPLLLRIERVIDRNRVVTAAQATSLALFRELFPDQKLRPGQLISTEHVTLLVASIADIDALYQRLSDAEAFHLLENAASEMADIVRSNDGAVVKQAGDCLTAVFHDTENALRATLAFHPALQANETTRGLQLKIGVHRGAALATIVGDRLGYFGAAARLAETLPQLIGGGEAALSEPVFRDPATIELLEKTSIRAEFRQFSRPSQPEQIIQALSIGH